MLKKDIKEKLKKMGVDFPSGALKADLKKLYEKATATPKIEEEEEKPEPTGRRRSKYYRNHPDRLAG